MILDETIVMEANMYERQLNYMEVSNIVEEEDT